MNITSTLHKNSTPIASNLSDKYAPVNTNILLAPFFNKGWTTKSHVRPMKNSEGYRIGKEQITLTHPDFVYSNGDHLTVECLNSNNGGNALMLMGGYGRIACSNGLIIGDIEGGRFIHRGTSIYEKLENQYEDIVAKLGDMRKDIILLENTEFDMEMSQKAVRLIVANTFERDTKKFKSVAEISDRQINRLLRVRRKADNKHDAFSVLNVVQENIVRVGHLYNVRVTTLDKTTNETTVAVKGKASSENKVASIKMNKTITNAFISVAREVA